MHIEKEGPEYIYISFWHFLRNVTESKDFDIKQNVLQHLEVTGFKAVRFAAFFSFLFLFFAIFSACVVHECTFHIMSANGGLTFAFLLPDV